MHHSEKLVSHSEMSKHYITAEEHFAVHTLSCSFHLYIHTVVQEPPAFCDLKIQTRGCGLTHHPQQLDPFTVWCIPMCMKIGTSFPL